MILIVSDNSPLNILIRLGQVDILPRLFSQVLIPPEVASEMGHAKAPQVVRDFIASPPSWLMIRAAKSVLQLPRLDAGESAAISLAVEIDALLLIDEHEGRTAATGRGLKIIGAIGVLERAANEGLITDLAQVFAAIRTLHFHEARQS